ncbi:MAG: F0F1-type ATP synthase assembly protein I [Candidatus Poriferisodalaceae bacterium]|jgi:F0F1-type ATP synthase assembly protein I
MRLPAPPQQKQNSELGDGLAKAIDIVLTPVAFGGIGWVVDRVLGTAPWFMVAMASLALIGKFIAEWYIYDHQMSEHEAERNEGRNNERVQVSLAVSNAPDTLPTGIRLETETESAAEDAEIS